MLSVFQGLFVSALGGADGQCSDRDSTAIQDSETVNETVSRLSEKLRSRQTALREEDLARCACAHAQLIFLLADAETCGSFLQDESRDAMLGRRSVRHRHCYAYIRVVSIRSECLPAVKHPFTVLQDRSGASSGRVGSRFGRGERPAADPLARRKLWNVLAALFFISGQVDVIRAE